MIAGIVKTNGVGESDAELLRSFGLDVAPFGAGIGLMGSFPESSSKASTPTLAITGEMLSVPDSHPDTDTDEAGKLGLEEGVFAFARWDEARRSLSIGTDRYGLQPLYYCRRPGIFAFAGRADWLLQLVPGRHTLNWKAFGQYIALRHPFGDETLWEEIRRVPQGSLVEYDPSTDNSKLRDLFPYSVLEPDFTLTLEQVVREGPEILRDAVARQASGLREAVVLLSGGYDSRVLAYGLYRSGVSMTTYTTYKDYDYDTDRVVARDVAKALGTDHHEVPLPADYIPAYHRRKCDLLDFATSYHLWMMPLLDEIPFETRPNFDGLGGDGCLGGSEAKDLEDRWFGAKPDLFLQDYFHWYKTRFEGLIAPGWQPAVQKSALAGMKEEVDRFAGHPNGLIYLGLRNFTRRAIAHAPYGLLAEKVVCRCPFFDHRLFDWMMRIPLQFKTQGNLYAEILRRFAQELASIPTTQDPPDKGPYFPPGPSHWRKKENILYLARTSLRLNRYLPGFLPADLPERCLKRPIGLSDRDALLGLADLGLWFDLYHDRMKWEVSPQ